MCAFFRRIFGGAEGTGDVPQTKSTEKVIDTLESLTQQEEQLEKRRTFLEKRINDELEKARALTKQQKKDAALIVLKKKKLLESQLQQNDNLIFRIGEQKLTLENQRSTAEAIKSMQMATKASKETMAAMNIDNVEQVLDEINETNDEMRMVQEALGQPTGAMADIDEDELEGEFAALEQEELENDLLVQAPLPAVEKTPDALPDVGVLLPDVPKTKAKTQEEAELAALEAELAI